MNSDKPYISPEAYRLAQKEKREYLKQHLADAKISLNFAYDAMHGMQGDMNQIRLVENSIIARIDSLEVTQRWAAIL